MGSDTSPKMGFLCLESRYKQLLVWVQVLSNATEGPRFFLPYYPWLLLAFVFILNSFRKAAVPLVTEPYFRVVRRNRDKSSASCMSHFIRWARVSQKLSSQQMSAQVLWPKMGPLATPRSAKDCEEEGWRWGRIHLVCLPELSSGFSFQKPLLRQI